MFPQEVRLSAMQVRVASARIGMEHLHWNMTLGIRYGHRKPRGPFLPIGKITFRLETQADEIIAPIDRTRLNFDDYPSIFCQLLTPVRLSEPLTLDSLCY